ncbi:hypothetical protein KIN20_032703 [Parelaphostrongylus tenuis]|uniref:Uncharacterized protein n=1 Tax=Parelaphostrongylus tenuis TaxID=148309 RepID=A0AAD5WI80_PARTN|nr:hypothetical protein KIN20_001156 [Parelaphostrongylus tenuis]KAJ1370881.1 hypothetical protein KIN20_032703 [Parelaphostrongylus tenuis]
MKILLLTCLAVLISSESSEESRNDVYQDPDSDSTMELLQKLHAMQNEIEQQYHRMPSADEMKAMEVST